MKKALPEDDGGLVAATILGVGEAYLQDRNWAEAEAYFRAGLELQIQVSCCALTS